jgi:putative ABC transport system substrate-binding protein
MSPRVLILFCLLITVFQITGLIQAQQQTNKMPRIGYLASSSDSSQVEAFRQGLRDLGYIEGKNILIEYRYVDEARPDRYASPVAELVQLKVDVLVVRPLPVILAARQATKSIPIVILINGDPVAAGLIDSLARPGGNITGLATLQRELGGKRLELLKEVLPGISRAGVLLGVGQSADALKWYEAPARAMKMQLQPLEVRGPNPDFDEAFQTAAKGLASAMITITNSLFSSHQKRIADVAIKNRLPSMHERSGYVEAGGLISYSSSDIESFRRAATYIDKILKGAKPADLPVEQPTKFELVINLKTAKQIGLAIPPNVLARADRVIR